MSGSSLWAGLLPEVRRWAPESEAARVLVSRSQSGLPRVGLVGTAKAGRSTLLGMLAGTPVAQVAARHCTLATVEVVQSPTPWAQRGSAARVQGHDATAAEALRWTDRGELPVRVGWPDAQPAAVWVELPAGVDPDDARWLGLDGIVLVSDAQQALSRDLLDQLGSLIPGVPVLGLVLSRCDRVRDNALADGIEPDDAVRSAARVAAQRLRAVLDGDVPVYTHTDGLPEQLNTSVQQHSGALAARAAEAQGRLLERVVDELDAVERRRLGMLSADPRSQWPPLDLAVERALDAHEPALAAAVHGALETSWRMIENDLPSVLQGLLKPARAAPDKGALRQVMKAMEARSAAHIAGLMQSAHAAEQAALMEALPAIAREVVADVEASLAPAAQGAHSVVLTFGPILSGDGQALGEAGEALDRHDQDRRRWLTGAAVAGAAAGVVLGGGILLPAAIAGGLATAAYNQLIPLETLRHTVTEGIEAELGRRATQWREDWRSRRADAVRETTEHVRAAVQVAIAPWVPKVEAERQALQERQADLASDCAELADLRRRLLLCRPAPQAPGDTPLAGSPWQAEPTRAL